MAKLENTFLWGKAKSDLTDYYNKQEVNNLLDTKQDKINNSADIGYHAESKTLYITEKWKNSINYNVPSTDRNRPYTNGTLLPYTIDGRKVYQYFIRFSSPNGGEANLVNGSFLCYFDVNIINVATKALIKPEDWNLRYMPGEAIRATIPEGTGNYIFICKVIE